jgi:hypothetical protein
LIRETGDWFKYDTRQPFNDFVSSVLSRRIVCNLKDISGPFHCGFDLELVCGLALYGHGVAGFVDSEIVFNGYP